MAIADRKQRAFEAREQLVIEEADELLLDRGYLGLNLDELADRVEYSKATLYHHFRSKEDLVLAVVVHHFGIRHDYFRRAAGFEGRTRERMFAFGIADRLLARRFPHGFPLVQLVRQASIWNKCSESRQRAYFDSAGKCFELAMGVAAEAEARGDFAENAVSAEQMVWGLVSLAKGAHLISEEAVFEETDGVEGEPLRYLYDNYHRFLDGAGWLPLSTEWDYEASRGRIQDALFHEEIESLGLA